MVVGSPPAWSARCALVSCASVMSRATCFRVFLLSGLPPCQATTRGAIARSRFRYVTERVTVARKKHFLSATSPCTNAHRSSWLRSGVERFAHCAKRRVCCCRCTGNRDLAQSQPETAQPRSGDSHVSARYHTSRAGPSRAKARRCPLSACRVFGRNVPPAVRY